MAILTKKTHAIGANIGLFCGVGLNIFLWLYVPEIFWFWWNAIGCLITFGIGVLVSILIKPVTTSKEIITYSAGKREVIILFGYFLLIVIISSLISKLF